MAMDSSYQEGELIDKTGDNYQRLSQTIAGNIKKISQNVSSMSKMVKQLQTPQDCQELRSQLRQIQNYTQKLAKDTSTLIMELMKFPSDQAEHKLSRERLSDEYMIALNTFQTTQKLAAQKSKEEVLKQKSQNVTISDPFAMGRGNRNLVDVSEPKVRKQEQLSMQTERNLIELEERERDVQALENDIMDVNQIFKELGAIIYSQGEIVASIESSVECAMDNVEAGSGELRKAAKQAIKARTSKMYFLLCLIVIVAVIFIVMLKN